MSKLSPKQSAFVQEYLIDLNATQAAIRAGYSPKGINKRVTRMMANEGISEAVQEAMKNREKRTEITQDRIVSELARIALFDPRKLYHGDGKPIEVTDLDDDTAAAVAGVEVSEEYEGYGDDRIMIGYLKKYKVADKLRALELLGKHLGMFPDKIKVEGTLQASVKHLDDLVSQLEEPPKVQGFTADDSEGG